jgi:hypothetical protein
MIVQLSTPEKVDAFRSGSGDEPRIVALGIDSSKFMRLAGLDALYMSLPRAERWGSKPLAPYRAALLRTTDSDQREGMPRYIITGMVLRSEDPNTAAFGVPRILTAVMERVVEVNTANPRSIRTVGFFEYELTFPGSGLAEVGRLFAQALSLI